MSKKHQQKLKAREERQKQQARKVVMGIAAGLLAIVVL